MTDCPAALNLRGQHHPCDWPSDDAGKHPGWAHANREAQAVWTSDPAVDGLPPSPPVPVRDERPHSRACGIGPHDHDSVCARDCPTCAGQRTAR